MGARNLGLGALSNRIKARLGEASYWKVVYDPFLGSQIRGYLGPSSAKYFDVNRSHFFAKKYPSIHRFDHIWIDYFHIRYREHIFRSRWPLAPARAKLFPLGPIRCEIDWPMKSPQSYCGILEDCPRRCFL